MDENPDTFVFVHIHQNDSYAIPWGNLRRSFYGVTGWPTAWFDGVYKCVGAYTNDTQQYNWYNAVYNLRIAVPTDVSIELGGEHVAGQTYRVTARVAIDEGGEARDLRIYMVHALDYYPYSSDDRYRNCVRLPTVDTEDITLQPGESQDVQREFTFDGTSWGQQDDIKIVVWAQVPANYAPAEIHNSAVMGWPFSPLFTVGDLNCDGEVDFNDINPFVLALTDPDAYEEMFPDCPFENRDINGDDVFDFNDINPFVALLSGS